MVEERIKGMDGRQRGGMALVTVPKHCHRHVSSMSKREISVGKCGCTLGMFRLVTHAAIGVREGIH